MERILCKQCIHKEVCGNEGCFDEALTYCNQYLPLPKEKRNAYKEAGLSDGTRANELCNDLNKVLGRYGLRLFALIADDNYNHAGDADIVAIIQTIPYLNDLPHLDSSVTG